MVEVLTAVYEPFRNGTRVLETTTQTVLARAIFLRVASAHKPEITCAARRRASNLIIESAMSTAATVSSVFILLIAFSSRLAATPQDQNARADDKQACSVRSAVESSARAALRRLDRSDLSDLRAHQFGDSDPLIDLERPAQVASSAAAEVDESPFLRLRAARCKGLDGRSILEDQSTRARHVANPAERAGGPFAGVRRLRNRPVE